MESFLKIYDPRTTLIREARNREELFSTIQNYVSTHSTGKKIVGVNVFDGSIAATYLILCQLYGKEQCKHYKKVHDWLVKAKGENKLSSYTWWTEEHDLLVDMAINGVTNDKVAQIENPFNCIIFAPKFSTCLMKIRKILPGSCKIVLSYPFVMSMPPWAIPGVLTSTLIRDINSRSLCFKLLLSRTQAYYKRIFSNYEQPFANFHQTTFQVALYTTLIENSYNEDFLLVLKKSWLLLNELVEPTGYVTRFRLPVWDTAWTILSLSENEPKERQLRHELCQYLSTVQQSSGGWAFTDKAHPPDNDDTALAILALLECPNVERKENLLKALEFLLLNQRLEGGWATYGKGNWAKTIKYVPSIRRDVWWTLRDVPVADITSHVIWALARLYDKVNVTLKLKISKAIKKAIDWLYVDTFWEDRTGYLYGRWTQTFVPTTSHAAIALHEALEKVNLSLDTRSIAEELLEAYTAWLKRHCWNGCGESWQSYHEGRPLFETYKTIEHSLISRLALAHLNMNPPIKPFDKSLQLGVNMAAFDVYVNTVTPIWLSLLADKLG